MAGASEKNQKYFNELASKYDSDYDKTIKVLVAEIQARKDFIGVNWAERSSADQDERPVRLLDYACGTGLVSRALAPFVTQSTGVDIADNMVKQYNENAEKLSIPKEQMYAYQGSLTDDVPPPQLAGPEFHNFDIAAVGLGFHHFGNPALAAKRLVERLRPGGVLFIIDFPAGLKVDHHHAAAHTITHHGFSEEAIQKVFEEAGAGGDFGFVDIGEILFHHAHDGDEGSKRRVFFARGTKI